LLSNTCNVGNVDYTAVPAALDFTETFKDFKANVAFGFSHFQPPFESAAKHGQECSQPRSSDTLSASRSRPARSWNNRSRDTHHASLFPARASEVCGHRLSPE